MLDCKWLILHRWHDSSWISSLYLSAETGPTTPLNHSCIYSFTHSSIHSLVYSFIHSFVYSHSLTQSFTYSLILIRSFIHSLMHSFINSLVHYSFTHAVTHSFIYWFIHSFNQSLNHSLTHWLMHSFVHLLIQSLIHTHRLISPSVGRQWWPIVHPPQRQHQSCPRYQPAVTWRVTTAPPVSTCWHLVAGQHTNVCARCTSEGWGVNKVRNNLQNDTW